MVLSAERPDRLQTLLLRAALLPPDRSLAAWEEWKAAVDLPRLDPGSQRLLPQLYVNLRRAGVRDSLVDALRVAYRQTWVTNRVLFRELAVVLATFRRAGTETLLLKGAALIPLVYRDHGARPMADLDIVVPVERAAASIDLLRGLGWRPDLDSPQSLIGLRHADGFVDSFGRRLDLHWSVLQECCGPGDNDDFWQARVPLDIEGVPTHVLCASDQLLQVCVHGARSSAVQPLSWIADATMILNSSSDQVDWTRVLDQTARHRLTVPMLKALTYLHAELGVVVPVGVVDSLEATRTSRFERLEFKVKTSRRELVGTLPVLWFDYWRRAKDVPPPKRLLGFPSYLQRTFRVRSLWGLPLSMAALAARRIASAVRARAERGHLGRL